MSNENTESFDPGTGSDFDSLDCVNLVFEGLGDSTVRPCPPERLKYLLAEKEKIARWQGFLKEQPGQDPDSGNN